VEYHVISKRGEDAFPRLEVGVGVSSPSSRHLAHTQIDKQRLAVSRERCRVPDHVLSDRSMRRSAGSAHAGERGVTLIGPGRLGQALGRLLAGAGVPIRFVVARRLSAARRAVRFIGRGRSVSLGELGIRELAHSPVILLTVADSAIAEIAAALDRLTRRHGPGTAALDWSARIVLHTCGSLPAAGPTSVLAPLKRRGAAVGSLHPFQTIPSPASGFTNLVGCYWGIEGDAGAVKVARKWIGLLDGTAFPVQPGQKTLYHASAFLVSPTLVTLMHGSEQLLARAGVPRKIARPMLGQFVSETVKNFVEVGGKGALTGPASRGDWSTINRHRAALRRVSPDLLPAYEALLRLMLRLSGRQKQN